MVEQAVLRVAGPPAPTKLFGPVWPNGSFCSTCARPGLTPPGLKPRLFLQETELRYYDAETDSEPKCVIELKNMVLDTSAQAATKLGKPHSFVLKIDQRQVRRRPVYARLRAWDCAADCAETQVRTPALTKQQGGVFSSSSG